jgi:hypothetical protein
MVRPVGDGEDGRARRSALTGPHRHPGMQRFYPDIDRTRFRAGWLFMVLGGLGVAALFWRIGAAGFNGTRLVLLAMAGGLAVWGRRLALKPDMVLEVDLGTRTYVLVREGRRAAAAPLDELGPLTSSERTRVSGSGRSSSVVTEYVVKPSAHQKVDFFVMRTPEAARRKMEGLARAWRLPCRSMDGAVRAAEDLDKPLHERLHGSRPADPAALRPDWNLRIEELRPGYALVSSNRSWASVREGWAIFVGLAGAVGLGSVAALPATVRDTVREMQGDTLGRVFLGLGAVVVLAVLVEIAKAFRDVLHPGAVRVTPAGVSYRGKRLRFAEIEEVTSGARIQILGDRRKLRLSPSFCPPEACSAVVREIERMIVAVGPMAAR